MSEFVVAVFPDETKAYEGLRAVRELHDEGSVTVYGTAIVHREANGTLSVKQTRSDGPIGLPLGALIGGLIGVFGGPAGVAAGAAAGIILGGARDVFHLSISNEFLDNTAKDLTPGKYALVAELSEDWMAPIDVRMEALGARVIREEREEFIGDLLERQADARRRNIAQWEAEEASARAERMESRLDAKMARERERLQDVADKAQTALEEKTAEFNARLKALEDQAAKATGDTRRRIDQRTANLRREFTEAERKLTRAYELSREAAQERA